MTSVRQSPPPRSIRRASVSPSRDAGVKGITRKVIRTLEGLGHLDSPQENQESDPLADPGDDADDERETMNTNTDATSSNERRVVTGKQRAAPSPEAEAKKKIDWEIPRKVLHSSIGFITLGLYLTPSMSPRTVTTVLWIALSVIATADFVRLRNPAVERVYERALGFLMRESERHGTNGTLWYILGVNFALTFYPIDVATVAILILSWADTAASTIGRAYGSRTPPLPQSLSIAWLPSWVWVPGSLLAPAAPPAHAKTNGHAHPNGNGVVKENPKGLRASASARPRRLRLPLAPRKSTAGFAAACVTGAIVAFMFWVGIAGLGLEGVAEMRSVAEGVAGGEANGVYHSQYSIAGQYLRSPDGAWARAWVPEGLIGGVDAAGYGGAQTTPARFGVGGAVGLLATVWCAGLVSAVAEALDLGGLDDNLTLPIISGAALMLFFRVWGWAVGAA